MRTLVPLFQVLVEKFNLPYKPMQRLLASEWIQPIVAQVTGRPVKEATGIPVKAQNPVSLF